MYTVLHIADFALQAVLRSEPDTQQQSAALFTDSAKKSVVLATTAAAEAKGVSIGMTAPQAVARCPDLLIRTPNASAESDAKAALLAVAFTVSPAIEDTAPGVCTIDLTGLDLSQHEPAAIAAVQQLDDLGLLASAGIAATPLLALYAARAALLAEPPPADPLLPGFAEPATQGHRTAGERVLVVWDATSFLAPLPIIAADPLPETASVLANWGIKTLGQLTALRRDDIGRRLGPAGLELWDRARGGAPRPLHRVLASHAFEASMEFENEVETLEPLLFVLRRFLERLTLELRTAGFVAAAMELTLKLENDETYERDFRVPDPTADVEILFRAVHTHLESLRTEQSIIGIALHLTPARPLIRQQGLFDTGLRDPHGFSETLARIAAIVGADRVGTPRLEDSHRPDAVKLENPAPVIPPAMPPPVHPALGFPLRRFRPPLRAQLELTDGRPSYLWTERFEGAVADVRGPWLASGDWWQPDRAWRRTEYDIALVGGGLYRLIYMQETWLIEGEYD